MFDGNKDNNVSNDQLPVVVHVIRSADAFAGMQKVWDVNARTVYQDQGSGKELLHFDLLNPKTIIWIQRDAGRQDEFELVMSWTDRKTILAEVFVVLPGPTQTGDDSFVKQVLGALLTTPATVPVAGKGK